MSTLRSALPGLLVLAAVFAAWLLMRGGAVSEVHRPLPELPISTLQGAPIVRSSFQGKPWVISIWAPDCSSCIDQIPALVAAQADYQDKGVGFLAISVVTNKDAVRAAADRAHFTYAQSITTDDLLGAVGAKTVPTTLFVSAEGEIVAMAEGAHPAEVYQTWAGKLLSP